MSMDVLMREIASLGPEDRRKLAAYLVTLQDASMPGYKEELARRADEKDPARWLSLDELDNRLGLAKHE
jgi:hypothetical protein